jgi:uncharacterized protein YeeX (DUF496 family)
VPSKHVFNENFAAEILTLLRENNALLRKIADEARKIRSNTN